MVPYVRMSFYKHFKNGAKYIDSKDIENDDRFNDKLPIDSDVYKSFDEKVYNYAMELTTKELKQAVEGMYHNLNTLQSRSGWAKSDCHLVA